MGQAEAEAEAEAHNIIHQIFFASALLVTEYAPTKTGEYPSFIIRIDVSVACVCPVIDHEFRHNLSK